MSKEKKIFVLDTSVILHDHNAIKNFDEHDVVIPIQVLEELDTFKKGNDTRNFESRSFIRNIDKMSNTHLMDSWMPIGDDHKGNFKVVLDNTALGIDATKVFDDNKTDHKILNAALTIQQENPKAKVILVSKDICLRLKAKSLKIHAEDYETGKIESIKDLDKAKTIHEVRDGELVKLVKFGFVTPDALNIKNPKNNHNYIFKSDVQSVLATYNPSTKYIEHVNIDNVLEIRPKNAEQSFALNAMLNPEIKLVTMQGMAGTGKTLLAMAAAIAQRREFTQIYVSRPVIPLSNKDIGYLPGDIKSKLDPYMQPIWDNVKFIKDQFGKNSKMPSTIEQMLQNEKIAIAPLAYIRGRSLSRVFFIVDEAQNLTPHEVKTIISRAGEGTKVIFTGDIHQIDTPYLDEKSNGLSYLINKVEDHPLVAHIALEKGQRSELANLANTFL